DPSEWKVDKDRFTILYDNKTYAVGTRLDLPLQKAFTFSSGVTLSSNNQVRTSQSVAAPLLPARSARYGTKRILVSGFTSITGKWSPKISSELGVMVNYSQDSLDYLDRTPISSSTTYKGGNNYALFQPYGQVSFRTGRVSTTLGARYMYSTFKKSSFDPRINIQYQLTPTSNLYLTGGQISQMLPAGVYLPTGYKDFLRKKFAEFGHMIQLKNWKLNSSVYYHYYNNVPLSTQENFSVLNYVEGAVLNYLQPTGTGTNKGVAVQAERSFVDGYYILAGASVYRSVYTDADNVERPTKFDGRYSLMVTGGREWTRQLDGHNSSFGIHGRMMYLGGLRDTPINENASAVLGFTYYTRDTYSVMLKDYMRFDLRLSWRKDKVKYTRTIALDVQNFAGIKNQAYKYYDAFQGKVIMQYQVGFIPVLVYRIDF
ncbi:MAG TPA: TonB-dependent receptor, partial [Cyclobacteriaceae bacterium]